ncbi:hypothetical protein B5J93_09520 [Moraxella equi]|uniref:Uncharacterized protein n=3 Tax=Moraxella equi TaxID=60442 RepID=A0ABX3NGV0_9GAMM|nr:hypothetical protein B5J93_09520 [Moraxella equi]
MSELAFWNIQGDNIMDNLTYLNQLNEVVKLSQHDPERAEEMMVETEPMDEYRMMYEVIAGYVRQQYEKYLERIAQMDKEN